MPDVAERRVLAVCAFVSAAIAIAPREYIAGGICGAIGLAMLAWSIAGERREARARPPEAAVATAGPAVDGARGPNPAADAESATEDATSRSQAG